MLNLISISTTLFFIGLSGWTFITYFFKKNSQKPIREELSNIFENFIKVFSSLKNLIRILANASLPDEEKEITPLEDTILRDDEQPLSLVQPIKEIKDQSQEIRQQEVDEALVSFSPEVVEVINEEEEKVA